MAEEPKAPYARIRHARSVEVRPVSSVIYQVHLGEGVILNVERFEPYGHFGFRLKKGFHECGSFDCLWEEADARAAGVRAAIVRFGLAEDDLPAEDAF